tara:strand:- start:1627 stop:2628 length:1002 start_codon:yes stop_codon:yes gene_type:complete
MSKNFNPIIGISTGDPNGIGIEIILKSLKEKNFITNFIPIIFSNYKLINSQKSIFKIDCKIEPISNINEAKANCINIYNINDKEFQINFGKANELGGEFARDSLTTAANYLKNNEIHALVTAPINKNNIQSSKFNFKGHTDFLESLISGDSIMFMVSDNLKMALLTEHISINEVTSMITPSLIKKRVKIVQDSLVNDFKVSSPKIAILSINPHVGDGGVIGDHDDKILSPSINEINKNGIKVYGPFASDSFFGSKLYKSYDAIIASYHDQGLIPFKTLTFGKGVNFTAGLDKVRTSPDHGTAYDIAGKNIADPNSFKSAVLQAINILKSRGKI